MSNYTKIDPGFMLVNMVAHTLQKKLQRTYFWKDSFEQMHEIETVDLGSGNLLCKDGLVVAMERKMDLYMEGDYETRRC